MGNFAVTLKADSGSSVGNQGSTLYSCAIAAHRNHTSHECISDCIQVVMDSFSGEEADGDT
jgi:hypothetical protein